MSPVGRLRGSETTPGVDSGPAPAVRHPDIPGP